MNAKPSPPSCLQKFTAFVAGKSKTWTFWNCDPSEFPWSYAKDEYAYVLAGKFSVQYEGQFPCVISEMMGYRVCLRRQRPPLSCTSAIAH